MRSLASNALTNYGEAAQNKREILASVAADSRVGGLGGVPDGGEGGVRLEKVSDDLGALRLQLVAADAANEGRIAASVAANSRIRVRADNKGIIQKAEHAPRGGAKDGATASGC